jgi:L-ascorbate metabolism protein UlaG (beta-lactamase superfamily)
LGVLYDLAFPRFSPPREAAPETSNSEHKGRSAPGASVQIAWLGTAGHVISTSQTTVLVDPYVSRHPLGRVATRRLEPDDDAIARWIPSRVDAVLCGHSHFDHLLDAPRIAKKMGCKLVGSRTTCAFARAEGVPESQLIEIGGRAGSQASTSEPVRIGDISVRFVPSLHGRIAFGRVPFVGDVRRPPRLPARVWEYKMGGAFGIFIEAAGVRVYHNGSADLIDAELAGESADVLLVGLAGRHATRDYLKRLVSLLSPKLVLPTHHDAFFAPLERGVRLLPGIDLDGFASEVHALASRARVIMPSYGEPVDVDFCRDAVRAAS